MRLEKLVRTSIGQWIVLTALALPVLQLIVPNVSHAQTEISSKPAFEIKIHNQKFTELFDNFDNTTISTAEYKNGELETVESKQAVDPIAKRAEQLRVFFLARGATQFADAADVIAKQPEWRKIVTIAFAESTYKNHVGNNYWGITYNRGLARYPSLEVAVKDVNRVLAKSYSGVTYEQMCGIYVQPCNRNWLRANYQIWYAIEHIE